jgi:hypothetical protein
VPTYYRLARWRRSLRFAALFSLAISTWIGVPRAIPFAAETGAAPSNPVEFLSIIKGYRSGVREPLQVVIRSEAEWLELWRKHSNDLYTTPPVVLFDQEIVAAIFLGEKPTGGYDVTIVRAERNGDELVIYYQEKAPAPGSIVTQAFMQPFHIVRFLSKDIGPKVTFRRES